VKQAGVDGGADLAPTHGEKTGLACGIAAAGLASERATQQRTIAMRQVGYLIGVGLLLVAGATLVAQLFSLWASGGYRPVSIGSMWFALDGNSLVGFQGLVERNLGSMVWGPIQFVLTVPAWISLAVPGALLVLLCRPRHRGLGGL
jgi:hypothetical protein